MSALNYEQLKTIRFESELLPKWAQLLDLAARLTAVSDLERKWFSKFVGSSGVDDGRRIVRRCETLRVAIQARGAVLFTDLQKSGHDAQPAQIIGGWLYALETMIMVARDMKTCSWTVEEAVDEQATEWGGEGELRRI